ncbi:KAT8 regulatory NSL complex subunit 1-like isoform X2 [Malaclemys terrapin pileata]|uniref:KAT8 regulatory NSL complex subunit 1-like isoform X2 n=1 Tax=Malaclemys terrapin pileata TaxID=2991368 RepID=UPI0023A7D140|nr:KAT8 regulatory NSL complex subunit 1-like isoform X2 [Malaclemys terrapin pileata]
MAAAMAPALPEPPPAKEAAVRGRQAALWGRARSLCRRLRALQAQQVERHVRQQLAGLVRYMGRAAPAGLPRVLGPDLRQLAASATARLRAAQGACDSDATESSSSSGGSSCGSGGETDSESPEEERPVPTPAAHHRAECQWAMERAAIICQWTWLQAQISDLEYRIRQQTDIYKQLRANKGPVVLGGDQQPEDLMKQQGRLGSTSVVNSRRNKGLPHSSSSIQKVPSGERPCDLSPCISSYFMNNVEKQSSRLTQSLGNTMCQSPSCTPISGSPGPPKACTSPHQVNGKINCLHTSRSNNISLASLEAEEILKQKRLDSLAAVPSVPDNSCVAARIRPICRYKKRKLVRANAVSLLSKKPQKPLTMKCSCEWPSTCILCGCKTSIQAIDPDTMSLEERIALLDSGFHPILSFSPGSLFKVERQLKGTDNHSLLVSGSQTHKHSPLMHHLPSLYLETPPAPSSSQSPSTANSTTVSSKKRKVECSYDINNIVIPMSMAAATRVEKLQYKEILTPSWRVVEPKDVEPLDHMDSELEDTSDETYLNHHTKYEELERARWDSWAAAVSHKRGNRSSNKTDGRWTLQPASPDPGFNCLNDFLYMHPSLGSHSPEPFNILHPLSIKNRTRVPLSCTEDTRLSPEILNEVIQSVRPWEPRTFPLSDTAYQALLEQPSEDGCKQSGDFQQWDSSNKQGIRTNSIDSGISNSREPCVSDMDLQTEGNRSLEVFTDQQCFPGRLFNNR